MSTRAEFYIDLHQATMAANHAVNELLNLDFSLRQEMDHRRDLAAARKYLQMALDDLNKFETALKDTVTA